jgi:hypothetical protein
MTLKEFLATHQRFKTVESLNYRNKIAVFDPQFDPDRGTLWHLDDYRVSSVSHGVVWMEKRTGPVRDRFK